MKKAYYMLITAVMAISTAASAQLQTDKYFVKETVVHSFNRIVIDVNANIVLVQNDSLPRVYAEGDKGLLSEITFKTMNNALIIGSTRSRCYKEKVLITIPVGQLDLIEVNSDATVACINTLTSDRILVKANNDCDVRIRSKGKVDFEPAEGFYIKQMKKTEIKTYEYLGG